MRRDFNHLLPPLRMMAVRVLGDHQSAEHVAQEALARGILDFAQPERIAHIVHGILANTLAGKTPHPDALARAISDGDIEQLRAHLRHLGREDRRILQLTYVDGLSSEDVARAVHEDETFVHERRERLLRRLRRNFANTFLRDEGGVVMSINAGTRERENESARVREDETTPCATFDREGTIARYVAGTSDKNETPAFEIHFLECRQCFEDVIVGAALRLALVT